MNDDDLPRNLDMLLKHGSIEPWRSNVAVWAYQNPARIKSLLDAEARVTELEAIVERLEEVAR